MYRNEKQNLYRRVLRTLRRIPPDIRQELATREFEMGDNVTCLVGTAVRAGLARAQNMATDDISESDYNFAYEPRKAVELFGGKQESWEDIFSGVVNEEQFPIIERAFTNALLETI